MSGIVWLASYPRSGNTWCRVFLSNFLRNDDQPAHINRLETQDSSSRRSVVDAALGIECADLTPDELDACRPQAYRFMASASPQTLILKCHDAYSVTPGGDALIPADAAQGVIYLVRNPLDVAVSLAHHSAISIDEAIGRMAEESTSLCGDPRRLYPALRQRLLSWSLHVRSWLAQNAIPLHLLRFEDMFREPVETFSSAVRFLGLPEDTRRVSRAVEFSSFSVLQSQERAHGFREKPAKSELFFRQGRAGGWRDVLSDDQIARVLRDHGETMRSLGYLSERGEPAAERAGLAESDRPAAGGRHRDV